MSLIDHLTKPCLPTLAWHMQFDSGALPQVQGSGGRFRCDYCATVTTPKDNCPNCGAARSR